MDADAPGIVVINVRLGRHILRSCWRCRDRRRRCYARNARGRNGFVKWNMLRETSAALQLYKHPASGRYPQEGWTMIQGRWAPWTLATRTNVAKAQREAVLLPLARRTKRPFPRVSGRRWNMAAAKSGVRAYRGILPGSGPMGCDF